MDGYYDKVLGCLPERDELAADIRAGAVLCAEGGDGQIIGMLHLALGRTSTEMRHFVVKTSAAGRHRPAAVRQLSGPHPGKAESGLGACGQPARSHNV